MGVKAIVDATSPFGTKQATSYQKLIWKACDWRALPQAWRQRLRKKYARKVVGPFDITHDKMKFRLYPAENYCDRVLFGRDDLPERAEHEALIPLLEPGMVFVDIGGNIGSYSAFVGTKLKGDLTLLTLEPHPRTFLKLQYNLKVNNLPLENVLNCGVADEKTTLSLWSDGGSNIGHTSMLKEGTANPKVSVEVPVYPLLDLLADAQIEKIDVLKIDIEGFEDRALAQFLVSAPKSLLPTNILIEIAHQHLWQTDLMTIFDQLGYEEIFKTQENRLLQRRT